MEVTRGPMWLGVPGRRSIGQSLTSQMLNIFCRARLSHIVIMCHGVRVLHSLFLKTYLWLHFLPVLFSKHMCHINDQEQPEAKATKSWFIFILSLLTYARFRKTKLRLFLRKMLLPCKSFQLASRQCSLILPC